MKNVPAWRLPKGARGKKQPQRLPKLAQTLLLQQAPSAHQRNKYISKRADSPWDKAIIRARSRQTLDGNNLPQRHEETYLCSAMSTTTDGASPLVRLTTVKYLSRKTETCLRPGLPFRLNVI